MQDLGRKDSNRYLYPDRNKKDEIFIDWLRSQETKNLKKNKSIDNPTEETRQENSPNKD